MKGSWNRIMKRVLWVWLCLPLLAACSNDEGPLPAPVREMDCEVSVSIKLGVLPKKEIGDPGTSPGEEAENWDRLNLFLVYAEGDVLQYALTPEELAADNPRTFYALSGTLKGIYGVAYKTVEGAPAITASSEAEVLQLQTASLSGIAPAERKDYMLSLFSGKNLNSVEIQKEEQTDLSITLYRLATKVDVQWDVQDAYENGGYTRVKMNEIEFFGLDNGFFFPEAETRALPGISGDTTVDGVYTSAYKADDPISERNGRTYFYTFPGVENKFRFTVDYSVSGTPNGGKTYVAVFKSKLEQATWHKVNFAVSGSSFMGDNTIELIPSAYITGN